MIASFVRGWKVTKHVSLILRDQETFAIEFNYQSLKIKPILCYLSHGYKLKYTFSWSLTNVAFNYSSCFVNLVLLCDHTDFPIIIFGKFMTFFIF